LRDLLKAELLVTYELPFAKWMIPIAQSVLTNALPSHGEERLSKDEVAERLAKYLEWKMSMLRARSLESDPLETIFGNHPTTKDIFAWFLGGDPDPDQSSLAMGRVTSNFKLHLSLDVHSPLGGAELLRKAVELINDNPTMFLSNGFAVYSNVSLVDANEWIRSLFLSIMVKEKMLLRKLDDDTLALYIPQWFTGRKCGYQLGVLYAMAFSSREPPFASLSPEVIDLVIQEKYPAVIDDFYDRHYPINVIAKLVAEKVSDEQLVPTDCQSVSLLFSSIAPVGKLVDTDYIEHVHKLGRIHLHHFVAGFKEGLAMSMAVSRFVEVKPWKMLYNLFQHSDHAD